MRIRTILAAAAAPLALGGVLLTATAASASTGPNQNSVITIQSQGQFDSLAAQGPIGKSIDIPANVRVVAGGATVNGNVTVEGQFGMTGDVINGNLTVSGPGSSLAMFNNYSHITGNLRVVNSTGSPYGDNIFAQMMAITDNASQGGANAADAASANNTQVDGGFYFQNDSAGLGIWTAMHVSGKFVVSGYQAPDPYGNPWPLSYAGLSVDGQQSIS
jgi:hypothetical protein